MSRAGLSLMQVALLVGIAVAEHDNELKFVMIGDWGGQATAPYYTIAEQEVSHRVTHPLTSPMHSLQHISPLTGTYGVTYLKTAHSSSSRMIQFRKLTRRQEPDLASFPCQWGQCQNQKIHYQET